MVMKPTTNIDLLFALVLLHYWPFGLVLFLVFSCVVNFIYELRKKS